MTTRRLPLVAAACSAALFVPLLIPLVTGRVFTLDDLAAYHIPTRYLYASALRSHESMLWTPAIFGGYYLFGEGQVGMAHPWHLLLYRFLPLTAAFNLEIISNYVVMFAGMLLLLKRLRCSTASRWFGAMVFTFSGYNVFHLIHVNLVAAVAHIPWILLLSDVVVTAPDRKTRVRAFIGLGLVVASQILVGHSQQVWFTLLVTGGLCGYFVWSNRPIARVALVPAAFAAGALAGGVQLFPLLDVAAASQRADWTPYFSMTFSLAPRNIVQLWSPFFFKAGVWTIPIEIFAPHEFVVYNGAFCTVALAWSALRWNSFPRTALTRGLLLLGAAGLILAFGRYGGLYQALLAMPGLRWFRVPARHLLLLHLSLSLIAALTFDDLIDLASRRELVAWRKLWPLAVPGALSLGMAVAGGTLLTFGIGKQLSNVAATIPWLLLFAVVPLLFAASARGAKWAPALLIVITACDLGYWGFHYIFGDPYRPLMTLDELVQWPKTPPSYHPGDRIDTRVASPFQNALIPGGYRVWRGYVGLVPELQLPNNDMAAELAGATWRVTDAGVEPIAATMGRARLMAKARVSSNVAADIASIDVRDEGLVAEPVGALVGPPGTVRVLEDRPGIIAVETTAAGRQILAFTERYDPGWHVEGGVALRVNGDYLGAIVDAGTHRLTFRFRPRSFDLGLMATAAGLLLMLSLVPFAL